jgi:UDP-N-acetylmuramate dehydrogenase
MELKENYSLKDKNTFGINAFSKYFIEFKSIDELSKILVLNSIKGLPKLILGGGSNILFTQNYEGVVMHNKIKGIEIVNEEENQVFVKAGAGEIWHDLVLYCINKNFGGIENLSLIPGTVGASPIQNIGAYGVELKDCFESLEAIDILSGKIKTFTHKECQFNYRDSIFKRDLKGKYIITTVTLKLSKDPILNISYGAIKSTLDEMGIKNITIKHISDAVCNIRRSKLPDPVKIGNAGSFFKNPEIPISKFDELKVAYPNIPSYPTTPGMVKVPAGWLNEQCGWKGKVVGNTGVHKDQALVLVNHGGAKGDDVKELAKAIQQSVKEKFGIELETEVNII